MNDLLYPILSCTLIMSLVSGIFLLVRRMLGERYAPRFRYYTWLMILAGFCLPYRPKLSSQVLIAAVPSAGTFGMATHAPLLLYLYVVGVLGFVFLRIWQHSRFRQSVRRLAIPLEEGPLHTGLKEVCREMGFDRDFRLAVVPGLASPMMTGLYRPRILLPSAEFTETEMRLIFRHELVHYQRKDLWYKLLIEIAHGIHWFNPLLPYLKKEIEQDLEASCDQRVIFHSTREEQLVYCHAILEVVRAQGGLHTTLSTSFGNSKEAIQKRFEEILSTKRRRRFLAVGALVFFLTLFSGQILYITDYTGYTDVWASWGVFSNFSFFNRQDNIDAVYTLGEGGGYAETTFSSVVTSTQVVHTEIEDLYAAGEIAESTQVGIAFPSGEDLLETTSVQNNRSEGSVSTTMVSVEITDVSGRVVNSYTAYGGTEPGIVE